MRATALIVWTAALTGCAAVGKCGPGDCTADEKISDEVRTLLAQSPALGAPGQISVQTIHGVVYLRGLVSTPYLISEAASSSRVSLAVNRRSPARSSASSSASLSR